MKKINIPKKEEIVEYFITQNHTKDEACNYFKVSPMTFTRWCRTYNIYKQANDIYNTIINKYGTVENKEQIALLKRQQTCLKKYGVKNVLEKDSIKNHIKQTCINKYGVDNPFKSPEIINKIKQTCINKYGVDNPFKNQEIQQNIKKTIALNYNVDYYSQKNILHYDIWSSDELFIKYLREQPIKPTILNMMKYFNISDVCAGSRVHKLGVENLVEFKPQRSCYEDEIITFLHSINIYNIILNDRDVLTGQEIDIYIPDYHVGIEFNGDYWHSDIFHQDHQGRSKYHQNKSLQAEKSGIFLFHIFEHEWNDVTTKNNICNRLKTLFFKNQNKISARKCKIIQLTKEQKKNFLNCNHIQGNDHSTYEFGLLYQDEIVSCMTFIKPKNKKYTWELSRFCNKQGTTVQGGASKLFNHFVQKLSKNETISSYNDITKTKGDLYKILGFECVSVNDPNYVWINFNTSDIRTRYQEQDKGENKRMHDLGYHRVCDCGTKTWVYTKK